MSCRRQWKQKQMSSFICSSFFFPMPDSWQQAPSHFSLSLLSANSLVVLFLVWPLLFALLLFLFFPHLITPSLINFPLLCSFLTISPLFFLFFLFFSSSTPFAIFEGTQDFKVRMGFGLHAGWAIEGAVGTYVHTWCVMPWKEHLVVVKSF